MNEKARKLTRAYLNRYWPDGHHQGPDPEPPQNAPTEFWLSVLYYQKLFNSGPKHIMGTIGEFGHLSVHAEMELDEMVEKNYPVGWYFWMFHEIGHFDPDEEG